MKLQEKDIKVGTQVIFKERIYHEGEESSWHKIGDYFNSVEFRMSGVFHNKPCVFTCVDASDELEFRPVDLFVDTPITIKQSFANLSAWIEKYRDASGEWVSCGITQDDTRDINAKIEASDEAFADVPSEVSKVNHPSHYTWLKDLCGIEVIDITRHLDFDTGNCIKYLLRAGHKSEQGYSDKQKMLEDLKKAAWYLNDKIKVIEDEIKG